MGQRMQQLSNQRHLILLIDDVHVWLVSRVFFVKLFNRCFYSKASTTTSSARVRTRDGKEHRHDNDESNATTELWIDKGNFNWFSFSCLGFFITFYFFIFFFTVVSNYYTIQCSTEFPFLKTNVFVVFSPVHSTQMLHEPMAAYITLVPNGIHVNHTKRRIFNNFTWFSATMAYVNEFFSTIYANHRLERRSDIWQILCHPSHLFFLHAQAEEHTLVFRNGRTRMWANTQESILFTGNRLLQTRCWTNSNRLDTFRLSHWIFSSEARHTKVSRFYTFSENLHYENWGIETRKKCIFFFRLRVWP